VGDWLRYRVEVSADAVRRHINGRLVHEDQTLTTRDPWIAIRSPYYGRGEVKNIRITGSPNVPDVLHLTDFRDQVAAPFPDADHPHSTLTNSVAECWIPWYRDLEGHPPTWRREPQPDGTHVLLGRKFPDLEGSFCERLLRYHWPLPENFEIQYEFFYEPGEVEVHPALGRFAFLLHPDGLAFHEITNGPMDTGAIDPLNADPLPSSLPIVMKDGCWNQLTLSRQGSVVALSLNGESIGSFKPPKETDSRFGLFYYCDQTSAQIRNVTLKGSWPKEIPDWKEQELAGQDLDELNRLRDSFTNQFVEEFDAVTGVFPPNFQVSHYSVDSDDKITPTENGLQISLSSEPQRVRVVSLSPEITLTGDFDAIVEFSDFVATPAKGGNASISLEVNVPELAGMVGRTFRGGIDRPNSPNQQVAIAEFHNLAPGKPRFIWAGKTSEACTAGRLRIARRGAMVSFLIAEYDSDNYRLLDEREMTDAPLGPGTIRFKCYCTPAGAEPSQVSVTWNRLQILGEDILSPPRTLPNLFFENLFQID
ncbi:MAG: DUF1583 domain-containing protein, partial [Planctomycetaceae bacterium]|nr:DUF1583 domain-containing protein [Planctomycetaceae bacterium]